MATGVTIKGYKWQVEAIRATGVVARATGVATMAIGVTIKGYRWQLGLQV